MFGFIPTFVSLGLFRALDGQNRQSPIASVQRTQSTLASHSNSMWNERSTNERQSRDSNRHITNAGSVRTSFCVFEEI